MKFCAVMAACLVMSPTLAAPPVPFEITYNARYGDFRAEASRYLRYDAQTSTYQLQTDISLELLGRTLISVVEESQVRWEADRPIPLRYQYQQKGLNARMRCIEFDRQAHAAHFTIDRKKGTLELDGPVYDDLSSYLAIRDQLLAGADDVMFEVVDKDTIKTYHYRVDEELMLGTALGNFSALKLVRVHDGNPGRRTEIWLAEDYDFIPLKLVHMEPNNHTMRLDIVNAVFNGAALLAP